MLRLSARTYPFRLKRQGLNHSLASAWICSLVTWTKVSLTVVALNCTLLFPCTMVCPGLDYNSLQSTRNCSVKEVHYLHPDVRQLSSPLTPASFTERLLPPHVTGTLPLSNVRSLPLLSTGYVDSLYKGQRLTMSIAQLT